MMVSRSEGTDAVASRGALVACVRGGGEGAR